MGNILIVTELVGGKVREASFELASMARDLGKASGRDVKSLVIGSGVGDLASDFASRGGGETFVADDAALANYNVDGYSAAIKAAVVAAGADVVLISNTPSGWDVAPRIAAALDAGFVSDAIKLEEEGGNVAVTRRMFNGKLDARLICKADKLSPRCSQEPQPPSRGRARVAPRHFR